MSDPIFVGVAAGVAIANQASLSAAYTAVLEREEDRARKLLLPLAEKIERVMHGVPEPGEPAVVLVVDCPKAVTSSVDWPGLPPAAETERVMAGRTFERPRVAYLHDTKLLIAAIWPDAPAEVSLYDIAAKAKAHREFFEQYGERVLRGDLLP